MLASISCAKRYNDVTIDSNDNLKQHIKRVIRKRSEMLFFVIKV